MVDLPLWSPIFPNLNMVEMRSRFSRPREEKLALMVDLFEKYPQIEVVVIDGIGGTLDDWLRGEERFLGSPRSDRSLNWSLKF